MLAIANKLKRVGIDMTLKDAIEGIEYIIKDVITDDEEMNAFLRVCFSKRFPFECYTTLAFIC